MHTQFRVCLNLVSDLILGSNLILVSDLITVSKLFWKKYSQFTSTLGSEMKRSLAKFIIKRPMLHIVTTIASVYRWHIILVLHVKLMESNRISTKSAQLCHSQQQCHKF